MTNRKRGIAALVAAVLAIGIGTIALVAGFVSSSIVPIYVSIACMVLAAPLFVGGVVLMVMGASDRPAANQPGPR